MPEQSGIGFTGFFMGCWYRKTFESVPLKPGHRLVVPSGAVDYVTTVRVNGKLAGSHIGGYTPFYFDITEHLREGTREQVQEEWRKRMQKFRKDMNVKPEDHIFKMNN